MKVLLLGPHSSRLLPAMESDQTVRLDYPFTARDLAVIDPHFVVSFGYKHIVPLEVVQSAEIPMVNLHISFLPWNRGMHPNFWSWIENTPKGISIHRIAAGIDDGDILVQREIELDPDKTLEETYHILQNEITRLFSNQWSAIRQGTLEPEKQSKNSGSFHLASQLDKHWGAFPRGWQTKCSDVATYGEQKNLWVGSSTQL